MTTASKATSGGKMVKNSTPSSTTCDAEASTHTVATNPTTTTARGCRWVASTAAARALTVAPQRAIPAWAISSR